jgi:4-diphosphocytidyl-2-C-methyl-D-erythritol kinase
MRQLTVTAPAKINLSLDVVGRRPDGYHLLETVMQSISLADQITVQSSDESGIQLTCDDPAVPTDSRNTAHRAALLFQEAVGRNGLSGPGIKVQIKKRIPLAAGLAGGSADAAAVLFALNQLALRRLSDLDLADLALRVGADVPFCLRGGTVFCTGIGDQLMPLAAWSDVAVLLCCPDLPLLTATVFGRFDMSRPGRRPNRSTVLEAVRQQCLHDLAQVSANVLESVSLKMVPELAELKHVLRDAGAHMALMSGSGPSIYGLFSDEAACQQAYDTLTDLLRPGIRLLTCRFRAVGPTLV